MKTILLSFLMICLYTGIRAQCPVYIVSMPIDGYVKNKNHHLLKKNDTVKSLKPGDYEFQSDKTQLLLISPCGKAIMMRKSGAKKQWEALTVLKSLFGLDRKEETAGVRGNCDLAYETLKSFLAPDSAAKQGILLVEGTVLKIAVDTTCFPVDSNHFFGYRYQLGGAWVSKRLPVVKGILLIDEQTIYGKGGHPEKIRNVSLCYYNLEEKYKKPLTNAKFLFFKERLSDN